MVHPGGDVVCARTSPVDKALHLQMAAASQTCDISQSQQTQPTFPPSQAFPVTGQKSQSSLLSGQAFAVADTQNSSPSCMSNFSSMETGESQLPYACAAVSQTAATGMSQSDAAVKCNSAVLRAAVSESRVCIIECCISNVLILHLLLSIGNDGW